MSRALSFRFQLFLIWFCGYAVCVCMLLIFAALGYTVADALLGNFTQLTAAFAPYVAPTVTFWFTEGKKQPESLHQNRKGFFVAAICSVFYILVLVSILSSVFFREGEGIIESTLDLIIKVGALLAFLVGPAIGFFFSKDAAEQGSEVG